MRALLLSNGHGEDLIASRLGRELRLQWDASLAALPLVGEGTAYRREGIEVLGPARPLPSGGFTRQGVRQLLMDARAGLPGLVASHVRLVREFGRRDAYDVTIAVGDIYPLVLGGMLGPDPLVFLSTAKSEHIRGHFWFEVAFMKQKCALVFARDAPTAAALSRQGVSAHFVGNIMMDLVPAGKPRPELPGEGLVLLLLPGSHQDALDNLTAMLRALELLASYRKAGEPADRSVPALIGAVALASGLEPAAAARRIKEVRPGWRIQMKGDSGEEPASLSGLAGVPSRVSECLKWFWGQPGVRCCLSLGEQYVFLASGMFGQLLLTADLCLGLAGTANEQAAGMGVPVVAFPGPGLQYTRRFMMSQKRLLGDALVATDGPDEAAFVLHQLAEDSQRRRCMGRVGCERMGPPGGAQRIAQRVGELVVGESVWAGGFPGDDLF